MTFLFLIFFSLNLNAETKADTDAISLKWIQSVTIDTSKKIDGVKIGGLSGLVYKDCEFFAISDDRGRFGESRIIKFKLSNSTSKTGGNQFEVNPIESIFLFKKAKNKKVYDFEALSPFQDGWIVSSEGDWNTKPKSEPEILYIKNKEVKQSLTLPQEFVPKFDGKQTGGLYNNKAFEGMYFDQALQRLFLVSESGLFQNSEGDTVYHILEYVIKDGRFRLEKKSKLDLSNQAQSNTLYNGASEFLKLSEGRFLLLTRAVLPALSLQYANTIWLIERKSDKDDWTIKGKHEINTGAEPEELNQNYEGMVVFDLKGKQYLALVSDDNFNKFEKTVFSFFELEVK